MVTDEPPTRRFHIGGDGDEVLRKKMLDRRGLVVSSRLITILYGYNKSWGPFIVFSSDRLVESGS